MALKIIISSGLASISFSIYGLGVVHGFITRFGLCLLRKVSVKEAFEEKIHSSSVMTYFKIKNILRAELVSNNIVHLQITWSKD